MNIKTRIKSNTRAVTKAARDAANKAVREVAEDGLTEANDRVPYEEGTLSRSAEVVHVPADTRAAITYDTPYAVKQHEDPTLNHPRQGEPYWLERTVEDNADRYFRYIADRINNATQR